MDEQPEERNPLREATEYCITLGIGYGMALGSALYCILKAAREEGKYIREALMNALWLIRRAQTIQRVAQERGVFILDVGEIPNLDEAVEVILVYKGPGERAVRYMGEEAKKWHSLAFLEDGVTRRKSPIEQPLGTGSGESARWWIVHPLAPIQLLDTPFTVRLYLFQEVDSPRVPGSSQK